MSIKASNNPFPHDPAYNWQQKTDKGGCELTAQELLDKINEVVAPDTILVRGAVLKTGNELSIAALAFTCRIDQQVFTNPDEFVTTIAVATEGYKRMDILVFTKFSTIVKIQGVEGLESVTKPDLPPDTIEICFVSVFGSDIDEPVVPDNSKEDTANKTNDYVNNIASTIKFLNIQGTERFWIYQKQIDQLISSLWTFSNFIKIIQNGVYGSAEDTIIGGLEGHVTVKSGGGSTVKLNTTDLTSPRDAKFQDKNGILAYIDDLVILVNDLVTGGATKALTAEMGKVLQQTKVDLSNVQNNLNFDGTGRKIPTVDGVNNAFIQIGGFRDIYEFDINATGYADPGTGKFGFQNGSTLDNTYLLLNFTNLQGDNKKEYLSNLRNGAIITITNTEDASIVKKGVLFAENTSATWAQFRIALFLDKGVFLDGDNFSFTFDGRYYTDIMVPQEMSTAIFTQRNGDAYAINGQNGSTTIKFTSIPNNAYVTEIAYSTRVATIPKFQVDIIDGMIFSMSNLSNQKLLLKHASATAYHHMIFPNAKDFYLLPNTTIQFMFANSRCYFIGPMNVPVELAAGTTTVPSLIIPRGELTDIPVEGALERDLNGVLHETHNGIRSRVLTTSSP